MVCVFVLCVGVFLYPLFSGLTYKSVFVSARPGGHGRNVTTHPTREITKSSINLENFDACHLKAREIICNGYCLFSSFQKIQ